MVWECCWKAVWQTISHLSSEHAGSREDWRRSRPSHRGQSRQEDPDYVRSALSQCDRPGVVTSQMTEIPGALVQLVAKTNKRQGFLALWSATTSLRFVRLRSVAAAVQRSCEKRRQTTVAKALTSQRTPKLASLEIIDFN